MTQKKRNDINIIENITIFLYGIFIANSIFNMNDIIITAKGMIKECSLFISKEGKHAFL